MKEAERKKSYQQLEEEFLEARELIEAIRSGEVDVVRGKTGDNAFLKLERLELVEERKRLLHKLQESNDSLISEIKIRKEAERKLQAAVIKAEEATLLKDKFVSMVSHDLRNPLSTVASYLELVLKRNSAPLDYETTAILKAAINSVGKMDRLILDLLEAGRIKSGMLRPKFSFVNIYLVVVGVLAELGDPASQKGIMLLNKVHGKQHAYADETLIRQVVYNLVSNAVKFCNRGDCVTISCATPGHVEISVKDTGIGIGPDLVEILFDYDKKTSRVGTGGETGTGLGLPLCKEIVEAHDGELLVQSRPDEGSEFKVILPYVRPRILIVDDDQESAANTEKIISGLDADIEKARNGGHALELMESSLPHLVLLDILMPEIDGFGFLGKIRNSDRYKDIPVIVLSVAGEAENREKSLRAGANDFVMKANQKEELIPRIGKFIGYRTYEPALSRKKPAPGKLYTGNILLVEDDDELSKAMKDLFSERGLSLISAANEDMATSIYNEYNTSLDAMIVDMRLPKVNGVSIARHNYENRFIPLIVFTSRNDSKLALELLSYGVQDYLVKPVDYQYLLNTVEIAVNRRFRPGSHEDPEKYEGNVNSITIPSAMQAIKTAQAWLKRKVKAVFNESEANRLVNYASEIITNSHEHGTLRLDEAQKARLLETGKFDQEIVKLESHVSASITIAISVLRDEVAISISDEGKGFDYEEYLNMPEEKILERLNLPCGRGIIMTKKYFDSMEYSKGGSNVLLTKKTGK